MGVRGPLPTALAKTSSPAVLCLGGEHIFLLQSQGSRLGIKTTNKKPSCMFTFCIKSKSPSNDCLCISSLKMAAASSMANYVCPCGKTLTDIRSPAELQRWERHPDPGPIIPDTLGSVWQAVLGSSMVSKRPDCPGHPGPGAKISSALSARRPWGESGWWPLSSGKIVAK